MTSLFRKIAEEVFEILGPGHTEKIYHNALVHELRLKRGLFDNVESGKIIPINYKNINVGYCEADIVLTNPEQTIVIELKAQKSPLSETDENQVKKYMRLLDTSSGFLINFGNTLQIKSVSII
jgi:GxxExxY protein